MPEPMDICELDSEHGSNIDGETIERVPHAAMQRFAKSTVTQQLHNSPLLALPPEVRISILSYVLVSPTPIRVGNHKRPMPRRSKLRSDKEIRSIQHAADEKRLRSQYAVAWTCRQIYREAAPIYYSQNTFSFTISRWGFVRRNWLKNIGEKNYCLIRSLDLQTKFEARWPELDLLTGLETFVIGDKEYNMRDYRRMGKVCKKRNPVTLHFRTRP
ncbi:MAG: hypothetical protein L6R38_004727 [Xanthoria sp. 2 TBL-2021]|nr:MAG: hypothetical protein L6R38_004727 [Xanthoria sp. 2 TBL-2021]